MSPAHGDSEPASATERQSDADVEATIRAAGDEIARLCAGRGRTTGKGLAGRDWTMCVPARPDDSDTIFADLVETAALLHRDRRELEQEAIRYRELARVADAANGRATALVEIGGGEAGTIRFVISAPGGAEAEQALSRQIGRALQLIISVGQAEEVDFEISGEQLIGPSAARGA